MKEKSDGTSGENHSGQQYMNNGSGYFNNLQAEHELNAIFSVVVVVVLKKMQF